MKLARYFVGFVIMMILTVGALLEFVFLSWVADTALSTARRERLLRYRDLCAVAMLLSAWFAVVALIKLARSTRAHVRRGFEGPSEPADGKRNGDKNDGRNGVTTSTTIFCMLVIGVSTALYTSGCSDQSVAGSGNGVAGTYVGEHFGRKETIELYPDGTWKQTAMAGGNVVFNKTGAWSTANGRIQLSGIMVQDFFTGRYQPMDMNTDSPEASGRLVFNDDQGYVFKRIGPR